MNLHDTGEIVKLAGGLLVLITAVFQVIRWYLGRRQRARLEERLGKKKYAVWDVDAYTRHYLEPDCQSADPGGGEEPSHVLATSEPVFSFLDRALAMASEFRYVIVLADSGMGKSALLINYYARHVRRRRPKLQLRLFPVNGLDPADLAAIPDPEQTVLLLDALDEDTAANADLHARVRGLLELTKAFRKVLITCRTQFFAKDEEIPGRTGVIRHGPRAAGQGAEYYFHKLYLSPFTNEQVDQYLSRRYGLFQGAKRKQAADLVKKIPNIAVRPMLLAHVDTLLGTTKTIDHTFQIYEQMVDAWLTREGGIFPGVTKEALREFSELLALDLYQKRETRGSERIARADIAELAKQWAIPLDDWQLTGRSLLNRDAEGNYKFAHRSIMEYLFVKRFLSSENGRPWERQWTDQMKAFLIEMIKNNAVPLLDVAPGSHPAVAPLEFPPTKGMALEKVDLSEAILRGWKLSGALLTGANLRGADLEGADLSWSDLEGATLARSNLSHANMRYCHLRAADLATANLREANLEKASGRQAVFAGAVMEDANLESADLRAADLSAANLHGTKLVSAQLDESNFQGATLTYTRMDDASLERANFTGCNLTGARFGGAKLAGAIIRQVTGLDPNEAQEASEAGADVDVLPARERQPAARAWPNPAQPRRPTPGPRLGELAFCFCGSGRYEIDCHGAQSRGP